MKKEYESLGKDLKALITSPDTPEDVKKAVSDLQNKKRRQTFKSERFAERCVAFLTAKPDDLLEVDRQQLLDFCNQCRSENAEYVIESMTDRYTSLIFNIDSDTLSFIGIQFSNSGFNENAIRCFKRAGEIISGD